MSVALYDEALLRKFKSWFPDQQDMHILKPNESKRLFELLVDKGKDKPIVFPVIAISRDPSIGLDITGRRALSCSGVELDGSEDVTLVLNAIPMNISYQIDIYTKKYEDGDTYIRQLLFNLVNYPKMTVLIPYNNVNVKHVANLWVESEITDNSDIAEKMFADQFTRWTIRVSVHDAFFFSVPVQQNYHIIGAELEVKDYPQGDDTLEVVYDWSKDKD